MLINQLKTSENCGEIESAIYRIVYLASKGCKFANFTCPSKEFIDYFSKEGFKVEKFDFGKVKISW